MLIEKKYVHFLYKIVLIDLICLLFKVTKKVQGPQNKLEGRMRPVALWPYLQYCNYLTIF